MFFVQGREIPPLPTAPMTLGSMTARKRVILLMTTILSDVVIKLESEELLESMGGLECRRWSFL